MVKAAAEPNASLRTWPLMVVSCGLSLLALALLMQAAVDILTYGPPGFGEILVSVAVLIASIPVPLAAWLFILRPSPKVGAALAQMCVVLALSAPVLVFGFAMTRAATGFATSAALGVFFCWAACVYGEAADALRRVEPLNLCPNCGYDLRATPEPNGPLLARCPECGRTRFLRPS